MIWYIPQNKPTRLRSARVYLFAGAILLLGAGCFPRTDWDLRVDPYGRSQSSGMSAANSSNVSGESTASSGGSSGGASSGGSSGGASSGSSGSNVSGESGTSSGGSSGGASSGGSSGSASSGGSSGGASSGGSSGGVSSGGISGGVSSGGSSGGASSGGSSGGASSSGSGTAEAIAEIRAFLESQTGGLTADDPISLDLKDFNLGSMTQADGGWAQLMGVLAETGKYVALDLSDCAMTGTDFVPGNNADGQSKIVSLVLPDAAARIGAGGWNNFSALVSLVGENPLTINGLAFKGCTNLVLTELPAGVTSIPGDAFNGCTSLALTSLPAGVTTINQSAFSGCTSLALTSLPVGVTSIGTSVFQGCTSLALMELPEGVTSLGGNAFYGCANLAQITLPASVTSIGNSAFRDCASLATVICNAATPPAFGSSNNSFVGCPVNLEIRVPMASVGAYQAVADWSAYTIVGI